MITTTSRGLASIKLIKHHVWDRGHFLTRLVYFHMSGLDQKRSLRLVRLAIYTGATKAKVYAMPSILFVTIQQLYLCLICQRCEPCVSWVQHVHARTLVQQTQQTIVLAFPGLAATCCDRDCQCRHDCGACCVSGDGNVRSMTVKGSVRGSTDV